MNNEEPDLMQEIQSLWDWQDGRLADLSARPEAQPKGLVVGPRIPSHRVETFVQEHGQHLWRYAAAVAAVALVAALWLFVSRPTSEEPMVAQNDQQQPAMQQQNTAVVPEKVPLQTADIPSTPMAAKIRPKVPFVPITESEPELLYAAVEKPELPAESFPIEERHTPQSYTEAREREAYSSLNNTQALTESKKTPSDMSSSFLSDVNPSSRGFVMEAGIGFGKSLGNTALSVHSDVIDEFMLPRLTAVLGWQADDHMYGLECGAGFLSSTSEECEEKVHRESVSLLLRSYDNLGKNVDCYRSLKVGIAFVHNTLDIGDEKRDYDRTGVTAELEGGINFNLTEKIYIGPRASIGVDGYFEKEIALPEPLQANDRRISVEVGLWLAVGAKF